MENDLDAIIMTYHRLCDPKSPLTAEDIAYISGRLEEFLRAHGYVKTDKPDGGKPDGGGVKNKSFIRKLWG